jgi:hypothetical protein
MQRLCDVCHGVYANNSSFSGTTYYPQNTWCREENGAGFNRPWDLGPLAKPQPTQKAVSLGLVSSFSYTQTLVIVL